MKAIVVTDQAAGNGRDEAGGAARAAGSDLSKNRTAKLDRPMTCGYGIDAIDAARKNQRCGTNLCFSRRKGALSGWSDDFAAALGALPEAYSEGSTRDGDMV
jgi:hypothetical protein